MTPDYPQLYRKYFVDTGNEQLALFRLLARRFGIESGLYPGSFTHITPSLVIPHMVYVDLDTRCERFFADDSTRRFVDTNREYTQTPSYRFHQADFSRGFREKNGSFDLLVSLYAGFISRYCAKYLRKGGVLLANNSHGDAPLAYLDPRFAFIGVVNRNGNRFSYAEKYLDGYFVPRGKQQIDKEQIEKTMKGPGYTRTANAYVFRKVK